MLIIFDSGPLLVTQACSGRRGSSFRGGIYRRSEGEEGDDWDSDDGLHGDENGECDGICENLRTEKTCELSKSCRGC